MALLLSSLFILFRHLAGFCCTKHSLFQNWVFGIGYLAIGMAWVESRLNSRSARLKLKSSQAPSDTLCSKIEMLELDTLPLCLLALSMSLKMSYFEEVSLLICCLGTEKDKSLLKCSVNWSVERSAQPLTWEDTCLVKVSLSFCMSNRDGRQLAFVWFGHERIEKSGSKKCILIFCFSILRHVFMHTY